MTDERAAFAGIDGCSDDFKQWARERHGLPIRPSDGDTVVRIADEWAAWRAALAAVPTPEPCYFCSSADHRCEVFGDAVQCDEYKRRVKGAPPAPADALIAKMVRHWDDCALYTAPDRGECDCHVSMYGAEAADALAARDEQIARLTLERDTQRDITDREHDRAERAEAELAARDAEIAKLREERDEANRVVRIWYPRSEKAERDLAYRTQQRDSAELALDRAEAALTSKDAEIAIERDAVRMMTDRATTWEGAYKRAEADIARLTQERDNIKSGYAEMLLQRDNAEAELARCREDLRKLENMPVNYWRDKRGRNEPT